VTAGHARLPGRAGLARAFRNAAQNMLNVSRITRARFLVCNTQKVLAPMNEFKTDSATYTPNDFVLWQKNDILVITPKFQRRSVWKTPARSLFIDTLLRGMTVPPLYLRMIQNDKSTEIVREVIDGQQRVRSVLDFIEEKYHLSSTLNASWAGQRFSHLSGDEQRRIMSFGFPTETFKGISDQDVLELFCRLNMNGVPLNKQELRNGRFFGLFKQSAFALAVEYLEFWREHRIFTEQSIARMLEVELTSELLIAGHEGMQDKKTTIDDYYKQWENSYSGRDKGERRFRTTLATISETFDNGDLAGTEFRRPPLFYTLFCVVFHHIFALPQIRHTSPRKRLSANDRQALKDAVLHLSEIVAQSKEPTGDVPKKYTAFVLACQRQTDNIGPRQERFNTLFDEAF